MARGWESKSVESQIETAEERKARAGAVPLSEPEIARQRQREGLEMSRTRVLRDISNTSNPRYKQQLQSALLHLDEQLAKLG